MKWLPKVVWLVLFSLLLFDCKTTDTITDHKIENKASVFPDDWLGDWVGELKIYSGNELRQTIPMGLRIEPKADSDNHTYIIRYGDDVEASKRNYELITIDKEKGLFKIDEKNDIILEGYFLGGKFFQRFEVMGNLLFGTLEKQGDQLVWEMVMGKLEPVSTSGDTIILEEEIPPVNAYPIKVFQKAILNKLNKDDKQ